MTQSWRRSTGDAGMFGGVLSSGSVGDNAEVCCIPFSTRSIASSLFLSFHWRRVVKCWMSRHAFPLNKHGLSGRRRQSIFPPLHLNHHFIQQWQLQSHHHHRRWAQAHHQARRRRISLASLQRFPAQSCREWTRDRSMMKRRALTLVLIAAYSEVLAVAKDSMDPTADIEAWLQVLEAVQDQSRDRQAERKQWRDKLNSEQSERVLLMVP